VQSELLALFFGMEDKMPSTMQEIIDLLDAMACFSSYEMRLKYQVKILHKLNQLQDERAKDSKATNEKLQSLIQP
jgi:hypothetical protein